MKWEYYITTFETSNGTAAKEKRKFIDELGEAGWELVAATPTFPNGYPYLFFKRLKKEKT